jgi:hypothetical protein
MNNHAELADISAHVNSYIAHSPEFNCIPMGQREAIAKIIFSRLRKHPFFGQFLRIELESDIDKLTEIFLEYGTHTYIANQTGTIVDREHKNPNDANSDNVNRKGLVPPVRITANQKADIGLKDQSNLVTKTVDLLESYIRTHIMQCILRGCELNLLRRSGPKEDLSVLDILQTLTFNPEVYHQNPRVLVISPDMYKLVRTWDVFTEATQKEIIEGSIYGYLNETTIVTIMAHWRWEALIFHLKEPEDHDNVLLLNDHADVFITPSALSANMMMSLRTKLHFKTRNLTLIRGSDS